MLKFTIKPHDVLFFGSGKPFNAGGDAESIFPPFPHSFASAIYAKFFAETQIAISENQGIFKDVYGPFLKKDKTLIFPAPLDIMKEKKNEEGKIAKAYIKKQKDFKLINLEDTDLRYSIDGLLWVKSDNKVTEVEPFKEFITLEGLKKWLNNKEITKEDLIISDNIYQREDRVSIHLEDNTKTVKEKDGLYRVRYIRLKDDVSFVFWIEANFDEKSLLRENGIYDDNKLKEIFEKNPKVLKLGGEARTASYEIEEDNFGSLFNDQPIKNEKIFQILCLTPTIFTQENENSRNYEKTILESINGFKIISGAIDGYVIDGISSKNYAHLSNKTVRAIKPGSFLYVEGYKPAKRLDFIGNSNLYIGSNLVLIKELSKEDL